jgi:hypothetical protein
MILTIAAQIMSRSGTSTPSEPQLDYSFEEPLTAPQARRSSPQNPPTSDQALGLSSEAAINPPKAAQLFPVRIAFRVSKQLRAMQAPRHPLG